MFSKPARAGETANPINSRTSLLVHLVTTNPKPCWEDCKAVHLKKDVIGMCDQFCTLFNTKIPDTIPGDLTKITLISPGMDVPPVSYITS
jgi:hypothetical protein